MTLQTGDKLMSLTDVSEMLGIPIHTLYRWRYKGDGPVGYRVGRHVRYRREAVEVGWRSRPTSASKPGARISLRGPRVIGPRANQRWKRSSSSSAAPVARFLRPSQLSAKGWVCNKPHSKTSRSQVPRALARS
jgi:predicted DNA-binding transcriptional regulator AlpA